MVHAPIASKLKLHLQIWIDRLQLAVLLAIALPATPLIKDPLESQSSNY